MVAPKNKPADPSGRAIVNVRVFAVPRARLFQAFSDPARLASWWGPKGFTNTFQRFEFRRGGDWHLTMHSPRGDRYENASRFIEVNAPSRIVFEHLGPMHWYRMTITFESCPGGTRLAWHMEFESVAECAKVRSFVLAANEENFDRLASHLAGPAKIAKKSSAMKLTLTRIFPAPRTLVFAAWTQPKHLKQWSAPAGFTIPSSKGDLRPGGKWRACMVSPSGEKLWLGGVYREVVPDKLLVFTHAWDGEDGETVVKVRFSDHPRGTKLMFEQTGFGSAGSRDGHKGGWSECFVRLATHLAGQQVTKKRRPVSARRSAIR